MRSRKRWRGRRAGCSSTRATCPAGPRTQCTPTPCTRATHTASVAVRDCLLLSVTQVPKLYINPTRYLIWKQIRRQPGVTALSATINCTIGSFSVCPEV